MKKPVIYPGSLLITGTPNTFSEIDRLYPHDGNARRESLILADVWRNSFDGGSVKKSELIIAAAREHQKTERAFGDQARKNGDGFHRARCSMAKTCKWMLEKGLFLSVAEDGNERDCIQASTQS